MRSKNSMFGLFLATAALGGATLGCARHRVDDVSPNAAMSVRVVNNNFSDVDVFAIREGSNRVRLGTTVGHAEATYKLPPNFANFGTVRIFAVPIGGSGAARSGSLAITPGETIVFTIQQDLAMSSATVEQP